MNNKFPVIIGVMSGTSLDGIDLVACRFNIGKDQKFSFETIAAECVEYNLLWQQKLQTAPELNGFQLSILNNEFGNLIAEKINLFIKKHTISAVLISSHGHTVFHQPQENFTLQIGSGATIYAKTGIPVVCDFRSVDVALNGQGAPLVPVGDDLLFSGYNYCLNLGGIANISFNNLNKRFAYDICPCNLLLNKLAKLKGFSYDEGGNLARKGEVKERLFQALNTWPYYHLHAPKSLDKDHLISDLWPLLEGFNYSVEDKLATLTFHISHQIKKAVLNEQVIQHLNIKNISQNPAKVLVTGGGAFNNFLVEQLQTSKHIIYEIPEKQLIEFKEALVFAFLGLLRIMNKPNALAASTGAEKNNIGGALYGEIPTL